MVNGTQMTVTCHVDDLKISHTTPQEVTKFILALAKFYGDSITVIREKIYSYLGIGFDFSTPGTAKPAIIKYAVQILETIPELITSASTSPAADHLFQTREDGTNQLPEEQAYVFHHAVAQLLFLGINARLDLLTFNSFLTKRVQKPDKDDWAKLKRGPSYPHATRHMKILITIA